MNPETNPYIPAAGSRPPMLAGLLKKGLIYSRVDTELDFTVPQFATFIERIHPFDAAQRPRRGRPPAGRKS
jgi:hypothetical protein